ncbi:Hydroperoxide isomerase aloxe3 [Chytridiales sp. JEL 0842]|nr:Hydroperoxide isomerase aloxe3 [Chytridiales sp. JEL 0842]
MTITPFYARLSTPPTINTAKSDMDVKLEKPRRNAGLCFKRLPLPSDNTILAFMAILYAIIFSIGIWQSVANTELVTSFEFYEKYVAVIYGFGNVFIVLHHFTVKILVKSFGTRYENPEKLAMFVVYVFEEFGAFILFIINLVIPAVSALVARDEYIRLTKSGGVIMLAIQVYMLMVYTYEIVFINKKMSPMLVIHHLTCIFLAGLGLPIILLSVDPFLRVLAAVAPMCLVAHLTLDFFPHAYLITRKFKWNHRLVNFLGFLCQWPMTIARMLTNAFFVSFSIYVVRVGEIKETGLLWIWLIVSFTACLLLSITQVWCHSLYGDLMQKDQAMDALAKARPQSPEMQDSDSKGSTDTITVESDGIQTEAERNDRLKKRSQRNRTKFMLYGLQFAFILAGILGTTLNRGPRTCDANFNDELYLPSTEPNEIDRKILLKAADNGFLHMQSAPELPFPPLMGGTLGISYVNAVHAAFSKLFIPYAIKLNTAIGQTLIKLVKSGMTKITTLGDYDALYDIVGKPAGATPNALTDAYFGRTRVTWSPLYLTKLTTRIPLNVTNSMVSEFLGGLTLTDALQAGRLFIVDHSEVMLELLKFQQEGKFGCAPTALFFLNNEGDMMPVAIQLNPNGLVLTPNDQWDWMLAKMAFNAMDTTRIGTVDHFLNTHIALIPISTSFNRKLSPSHPVYAMLDGILLKNLGIINTGISNGLSPTYGAFVFNFLPSREGILQAISNRYRNWTFYEDEPSYSIRIRGVDSIPNHPFNKYSTRLYQASQDLFTNLVSIYYPTDGSILADSELQAFASDVVNLGKVSGFPSFIRTRSELARALGHLHYISTTLHNVMNGYALEFQGTLPASPFSIFKPLPTVKGTVNESNIVEWLPDVERALSQVKLAYTFMRPLEPYENLLHMFVGFKVNSPKTRCALQNYRDVLREISREVRADAEKDKVVPGWKNLDPYEIPNHSFV